MNPAHLTAWLNSHDPLKFGVHNVWTRAHVEALDNMFEVTDSATHTVSNATLIGDEKEEALNRSMQAKQNLPDNGTNPANSNPFVQSFLEAPAAGATTMLDMARISSGFNPLDPVNPTNVEAYRQYIKTVLNNVMFSLELSDIKTVEIKERDFNKLISEIVSLFKGIKAEDESAIEKGLEGLATAATSTKDVRQSRDLFVQNAMQIDDGNILINIYYSTVSMIVHDGKSTTNQTNYTIARTRLKFQKEFWNEITAGEVAKYHFKDLSDWLSGNTTKPGDDEIGPETAEVCFAKGLRDKRNLEVIRHV